jgi:N-acetylneuraminate synthase
VGQSNNLEQPLLIAEISGNHNGSLERAHQIIDAFAMAGTTAVKIQTYTADTITLNVDSPNFKISSDHPLWGGRTLYELYSEAYTPWEWHESIFEHCREVGVIPFSSPFDETAVEFLETLGCQIYKIASLEIIDLPLIKLVANTGKPLIISTGTATLSEISDAVNAARSGGARDLTLLLCTSSYPADPGEANLNRMGLLKATFEVKVGLSDHTLGSAVALAATALGADAIEKHVTISRLDGGVDSAFSMEPDEFQKMASDIADVKRALGSADAWRTQSEAESIRLRPSLYFSEDVNPGDIVTEINVRSVRPSGGLLPIEIEKIIGKRITKPAKLGDPTSLDYFEI